MSPFVVVGTQHVFIILIHCSQALDLPWSFLSWHDVAANRRGRGDVEGVLTANHQRVVDGGGAVLVGWVVIDVVGLLTYLL